MRNLALLITVLILSTGFLHAVDLSGQERTIELIRQAYYYGVEEEEYIDSLNQIITNNYGYDQSEYSALVLSYTAGLEALKSKHAFWPITKLNHLDSSMVLFEKAVEKDVSNLEIRFMRFSILSYVPSILGYDDIMYEDLDKIYELLLEQDYTKVDYEIQVGMAEFIIRTELLEEKKVAELQKFIKLAEANE